MMAIHETQFEDDLQHIAQVRNTTQITRRVFENEVASHVNALESNPLRAELAMLIDALMTFEEAVKREINNRVAAA